MQRAPRPVHCMARIGRYRSDMSTLESSGRGFDLQQRYTAEDGELLSTGVQALVRLPMDVMRDDRRAGHSTAAFISGYQGSPLGGYDRELMSQRALLDALNIVHVPGVNEELAATSVMGSQMAMTYPRPKYDGVTGIWYGKAPGLDRAGDAIRHGNFAGTSRLGGVLALVGDDSAAKSSTLPSRSDPALAALYMPVLFPGTIQEVLDFGRHGIAMSRASGLWVAMKITTPVADGSQTLTVHADGFRPVVPSFELQGVVWKPTLSGNIVTPYSSVLEVELLGPRTEMARRYVEANGLNRLVTRPADAWLGIIAGGYDCEQVLEACSVLGLPLERLAELGVRILRLGALNPLDGAAVRELARGTATVLVVEDKIDFLETRVRSALYGTANAPAIIGRKNHMGDALINSFGALTIENLTDALRHVLTLRIPAEQLRPAKVSQPFRLTLAAEATRTPFFCSGCPHNTGLQVPAGSLVGSGIGCHGMVAIVPREATGEMLGLTQMGGEGAQWIGASPFVENRHIFQNIGDGTFFHSGQLAVQAAVSAGTTVTYKILYNAAVAMTGGQDAAGQRSVPDVARKLLADGVKEVVITTDDPGKYRNIQLPDGATVHHRDKIIEVQERLSRLDGVTVLIHDQQCAAEKRRDRKRGLLPQSGFRVVIDERVCEGCGDCGVQSNCLSLHSAETEFGRKTVIDQASCNVDASCLRGDCPAFVTVKPGAKATSHAVWSGKEPGEPRHIRSDMTIRMPGIGGTGVVTVSQVLVAAAQIAGRPSHAVDQTGLSQKAGPVVSTVTIGEPQAGRIDVLLAFDLLAAATSSNLSGLDSTDSVAFMSSSVSPTGRMIGKVDSARVDIAPLLAAIDERTQPLLNRHVDASAMVTTLMGNAVTANVFLLGVAFQAGCIPLSSGDITEAVRLNGTAVEANLASFQWGRRWFDQPAAVETMVAATPEYDVSPYLVSAADVADGTLRHLIERRAGDLVGYQNRAYADRYVGVVLDAHRAETSASGDGSFTHTVAKQLHHVMAYKDEYEVARLLLQGRRRVAQPFGDGSRVTWNLHPPMLRALGMGSKLKLGGWTAPGFKLLSLLKVVRSTPLDVAGYTAVRRAERALVAEYVSLVEATTSLLTTDAAEATRIVGLVDQVRGYEGVKLANLARYHAEVEALRY